MKELQMQRPGNERETDIFKMEKSLKVQAGSNGECLKFTSHLFLEN